MKSQDFNKNLMKRFTRHGTDSMIFLGDARIMVSTSSSTPAVSSDVAELKDMVRALILDKKNQTPAPAPVKAVEQSCVTCGGGHSYQNCPATDGNIYRDNIQEYVSQAAAVNYNQGNASYRPQMVANQIRPPGFPPIQNNQNRGINFNQNRGNNFNQNRGNNFNQGQVYQPQINQPPTFQAPAYQAPVPPAPGVSKPDFDNYVKANDAVGLRRWRVLMTTRKLNDRTSAARDHLPLPLWIRCLNDLAGMKYYCFLDGISLSFLFVLLPSPFLSLSLPFSPISLPFGYFLTQLTTRSSIRLPSPALTGHLPIVACLLGYAMHRARSRDKMLQRCEDTNLVLNWEKCHFMVKDGIVLGHKISKSVIEVDKSKVDVIAKLPHLLPREGPMTHSLKKKLVYLSRKECIEAFETFKMKLTQAPILVAPDWDLPFEIMCDASDFTVRAVLGQIDHSTTNQYTMQAKI
ncbi:reverse transcriptase domain-containing protein [Tanacetum coccineum]